MAPIELDGSQGEGGGQILRTALSLSMITGIPFRLERIRANRGKPGLLRQHLTAIQAAAEICGARVAGAEPGGQTLDFRPGTIRGGDYRWAIGTAGSCTLVLQTVLPALCFADRESRVTISGGTHNQAAPPADFLTAAWLPVMRAMGADLDIELLRHGFYPAGGGELRTRVAPMEQFKPLVLEERGALHHIRATGVVAGVTADVAKRELERLKAGIGEVETELRVLPAREGPGNVLLVELAYERLTEVFTGFGEKGVPAETVADRVAKEARAYRDSDAAVGEYLADQLALPLALAGAGSFTVTHLSSHLETNLQVIEKFLPVAFEVTPRGKGVRIGLA